ncbi:MAG: hypothetical protein K2Y31_06640 [Burkholderiales bacterium]|jgi:hypothetical protein|nr:hypothetical protein [Burkholderiales bacterium]
MTFNQDQPAYISLRDQVGERTKRLLVWAGAGLSAGAKMPTWAQLKNNLIDAARLKSKTLDSSSRIKAEKTIITVLNEKNPWVGFKVLRDELLGPTSYQDEVKRSFQLADSAPVPNAYKNIWRLPIQGVLNLNIDRIATRAIQEIKPSTTPHEFSGDQAGNLTHVLNGVRPFIANLHGTLDNVSTWVFTHE